MHDSGSIVAQTMASSRSSVDTVISLVKTLEICQRMKFHKSRHHPDRFECVCALCAAAVTSVAFVAHSLIAYFVFPLMVFKLTIIS